MESVYLLTGRPGVGKTTLIKQVLSQLDLSAGGVYTEEIRENGVRKGFRLISLDGRNTILAHIDFPGPYRVGKYGVKIQNLDDIGVDAINEAVKQSDLIVIDEIGRMELFSPEFRSAVIAAVSSDKKVLGSIMLKPDPFADEIKRHKNVKLFELTPGNRERIKKEISDLLQGK